MSSSPSPRVLFGRQARRWRRDKSAAAAIEFALTAPAMLIMMAMIVFGGQGFEIQRKVTMTMRTLTDLVTQQCDVGSTPQAYWNPPCPTNTYTYSQIINAACLVMIPYVQQASPCTDPNLNFTIAEIQGSPASQVWCKAHNTANCPGGAIPSYLAGSAYVIYGNVQYTYNPLGLWIQSAAITFSDSFYMLPRLTPVPTSYAATYNGAPNNGQPYVYCSGC
jgi:hypothetical protein